MQRFVCLTLFVALMLNVNRCAFAVSIDTVPVGDPGNPGDAQMAREDGAVAFNYRIGRTEVTNAQYAEFLNAKAASDPFGLYYENTASDPRGGIVRGGVDGSYVYTVKEHMADKPAVWVGLYSGMRFAN